MNKKFLKVITILLTLSFIVSPVIAETQAAEQPPEFPVRSDLVPVGESAITEKFFQVEPDDVIMMGKESRYIVLFEGESLVVHQGADRAADPQAYLEVLASQRANTLAAAEAAVGRSLEVRHVYDVILNGVSLELSRDEAATLAGLPGVRKVLLDTTETLDTDAGPAWIGADTIWDGTAVPDGVGNEGEGILVGIIDTGINFDHPSFSDTPADGHTYSWTGDYLGVCAPGGDPDYASACNDKLVGAYTYTADNPDDPITPEDSEGHGSHTASTVAGNAVEIEHLGETVTISGMAPHAQIVAYDTCYPTDTGGSCAGEDLLAAVQQAVLDGVDVINYSISGGSNPYGDAVELAFLEAFDAGVVVSASAGNNGPDAATVGHRSPWVITTAASTHNRKFTSVVDFSDPMYQGIATLAGEIPFTSEFVASDVKFAGEDGNDLGCLSPGYTTPNFYNGSVALVQRGSCTFTEKVLTAEAAGASAVLIFTDARAPVAMAVDGSSVPNVMLDISGTLGLEIAAWVATQTDETVDISTVGYYVNDDYGDIMAEFSSRGPNETFDVLKPDVTAPGMEILAAVADSTIAPSADAEYALYQGTSMSSPHDAGAAALLYAQHPTWTPAMIKSALMLTAYDDLLKEDKYTPADPHDLGAGHIQLEMAGLVGLVMDETYDNMLAADPAEGGDVKTLNIASLYNSQCVGECSWTRTFTSVANETATYTVVAPDWVTVDPASFSIDSGATQEITITADVSGLTADEWAFGNIEFNTDGLHTEGKAISDVAIPIAVLPVGANLPEWTQFDSHRDAAAGTISDLIAVEITDLTVDTYGFVKGVPTTIELAPDPTNGDAFDDLSQVWYTTIDMTNGAARAVAEITASTAPDVDLFWGFDLNEDGMPQAGELYQSSATGTAFEYLSEWGFPVGFYDVWVLVQNWEGSGAATDDITLTLGLVGWDMYDDPSMDVTGPETNPGGLPFELDVYWSGIDTEEGDRLYGLFDTYADVAYETDLGVTEVDVIRGVDDVVKTVDVDVADPGDTVTYTITINNYKTDPLDYIINDVLPSGVTYVPGSVTGGAVYDDVTNAITWSGTVEASYRDYVATTSAEDAACTLAIMPDGDPTDAYLDWETTSYNFTTTAGLEGDGLWYSGFYASYPPFNYYGEDYIDFEMTDDARVGFDMDGYDFLNQDFPNPTVPNNTLGIFWDDFVIEYDEATNKGLTAVGDAATFATFEYDDIYLYDYPAYTLDVEVGYYLQPDDTPGAYEIIYAYDNITPGFFDVATGTIGMENSDGTVGTTYSYNDPSLTIADGSAICFDWTLLAAPPQVITFQVTVDTDAPLTVVNEALHDNDALGTVEEIADAEFSLPTARLQVAHLAPFADPGTVDIKLNGETALENVDYGDSTGYIELLEGSYLVEIVPDGATDPAITETVDLVAGNDYTAIAVGDGSNQPLGLLALLDDNTAPAAGNFKLRLGHLAPFAADPDTTADVRLDDGTVILDDVDFGDVAPYTELPAGEYDLKITTPDGATTLINLAPVNFSDGQILSAFAVGDGTVQPLGGFALPSGAPGFFLPLDIARLQVAHLAPFADPGTVDIELNGELALENINYGDSTAYIELDEGSYLVEIFPDGSTTAAISKTVDLEGTNDYTAIAVGDGVNQPLDLLALLDDNTTPTAGNFKLRLGHLAPFASDPDTTADVRLDDGTLILDDVDFGDVADYIELPAGDYDLMITTPDGGIPLINLAPVSFIEGQILSAFAVGNGTVQPLGGYALPADATGFFIPTEPMPLKLNEFVANHVGTDTEEYVEVYGAASTDYSGYTVLEIEGDSSTGNIDRAFAVGTTDANGLYLMDFTSMENGTITLLLVEGFTGSTGDDIDTDDDGVIDNAPWTEIVDDVAVWDDDAGDLVYSATVLNEFYDGFAFTPGGASRIPDGYDTNSVTDWVRNDFNLAGIPGETGTPVFGEAYNTPGEPNMIVPFKLHLPLIFR